MTRLLAKLPSPLFPGRRFGHGLLAFYVWLTAFYLLVGVYSASRGPSGDSLTQAPVRTVLALLAAFAVATAHGWGLSDRRRWIGNVRLVAILVALLGTAAGLRPLVLAGASSAIALLFLAPAVALLVWVAVDVQRHARVFSAWRQGCDAAMAGVESRTPLSRIVAVVGALWALQLVLAAINRYYRLVALADTSRFAQGLYYALLGQPGFETIDGINHLGVHFTPALGLYLPFYAVATNAFALIALQSLALAAAAIPVWFLARQVTGSYRAAFVFALVYLFHPHVQGFNINGFRESGLWPLLGFTYLLALEQERFWRKPWVWLLLPLALGVKEDIPVTVAAISLAHFIRGRDRGAHLAIIGISAAWFLIVTKAVMPWFLGSAGHPDLGTGFLFWYRYRELMPAGQHGFTGFLLNAGFNPLAVIPLLMRPGVLLFLVTILAPLLFLPLLSGWYAVALLPGLYLTNALPNDVTMYSTLTQFIAYLVPLFYCAMQGWTRASQWLERWGFAQGSPMPYLALGITLLILTQHAQPYRPIEPERTAVLKYLEALPRDLKVVVPDCLSAAVSARKVVRWVAPNVKFDDVDLVMGENQGSLCRGVNWGFPELEKAVIASGLFVREPGPIPSLAVYRRKG